MEDSDDLIRQRPALALGLTFGLAAVAYAVISLVMRGTVNTVEVAIFAVVFAVVYVVFAFYSETIESVLGSE